MRNGRQSVLVVTGTVGVGKTSTAEAVGRTLQVRGQAHAVIDLDWLRNAWPAPVGDAFNEQLMLTNLRSVADNARMAGHDRLILAGVVESADMRSQLRHVLGAELRVVRFRIDHELARSRLTA